MLTSEVHTDEITIQPLVITSEAGRAVIDKALSGIGRLPLHIVLIVGLTSCLLVGSLACLLVNYFISTRKGSDDEDSISCGSSEQGPGPIYGMSYESDHVIHCVHIAME